MLSADKEKPDILESCNEAYESIALVLRIDLPEISSSQRQLLEIEILGSSHPVPTGCHVLQDGNAIAVPKASLVQAFFEARRRFIREIQSALRPVILETTAVILLFDPEHLTAANARKRVLSEFCRDQAGEALHKAIHGELWLIDSLLTSRLHRHTKSPTLWNHRRWLLHMCTMEWGLPADVYDSFVRVVMVSGERHPRNYYAWNHARYLISLAPGRGYGQLDMIVDAVKQWVFRHHNDTSGWSFLQHLSRYMSNAEWTRIYDEAIELAVSLRWGNESVWMFLRTAAAWGGGAEDRTAQERFATAAEKLKGKLAQDPRGIEAICRAEDWLCAYCGTRTTSSRSG